MEAALRGLSPTQRIWALGWGLQGLLALVFPLVADEAYYQDWAEQLALGYFDHPPGIAWWIAVGGGHPRLLGWVLAPLQAWFLADTARRVGVADAWMAPTLMLWTPLGLAGGALATPDIPLVFGWIIVVWAVFAQRTLVLGVAFAWCLWSKSTALVAVPCLLWVLPARRWWALPLAAGLYSPHLWWSAQNEWLPWSFQWSRTSNPSNFFEFVGGQVLLVTPLVIYLAVVDWRRPVDSAGRQLRALSLPMLGAFVGLSAVTRVEGNWPCFAWVAAVLSAARASGPRVVAGLWVWAVVLGVVLSLFAFIAAHRAHRYFLVPSETFGLPVYAARYQERALGGPKVGYMRAVGHRRSQYDRWGADAPPGCGFVYHGNPRNLGERCAGEVEERPYLHRGITVCRCPGSTKNGDSPN